MRAGIYPKGIIVILYTFFGYALNWMTLVIFDLRINIRISKYNQILALVWNQIIIYTFVVVFIRIHLASVNLYYSLI